MHIHLLFWHRWSVQKMFITFLMSLSMGSIVAKTGCKMHLFLVQSFRSLGRISKVEFQNKVSDILVLFSKLLLKNYELADDCSM
jgi:hypothetical protein